MLGTIGIINAEKLQRKHALEVHAAFKIMITATAKYDNFKQAKEAIQSQKMTKT